MRKRQDQGAHNCQSPVGNQSVHAVSNGAADRQHYQACQSPGDDTCMGMPSITQSQRDYAHRKDDDQQLSMQVIVAELPEKGQYRDRKRQQQAMQQAQAR